MKIKVRVYTDVSNNTLARILSYCRRTSNDVYLERKGKSVYLVEVR